jgi:hypothetical protein
MAVLIVESFPKPNPNIEQAKTAAQSTEKACRNEAAYEGVLQEEIIIRPLRRPGKDYKQNSGYGADQNEKKDRGPVQPHLRMVVLSRILRRRIENCGADLVLYQGLIRHRRSIL